MLQRRRWQLYKRRLSQTLLVRTNICFMDEWLFLTKLSWGPGTRRGEGGGGGRIWLIGDLTITFIHHTAGGIQDFRKGGFTGQTRDTKSGGGGGGGGHTHQAQGGGVVVQTPPPPPSPFPLCVRHDFETASCLTNYQPRGRLVILSVAFSVTRSFQPNGKNFFCCTLRCRIVLPGGHSGQ